MKDNNKRVFEYMSMYLNYAPHFITPELMERTGGDETAFAALIAALCMLDTVNDPLDKELYRDYFIPAVHKLDPADFEADEYYKEIKLPQIKQHGWELTYLTCKAYEGFVCGDPVIMPDGRIIPQIGYFERDFEYPAVLQDGREWMTLLPNEIITTKPHIQKAHGKTLTFGLGLGYFAYAAANKINVNSVTVVERDEAVIKLFTDHILPQMKCKDKIRIICGDAFDYAEKRMANERYDFVFTDIWHDPSDGVPLYLKMKDRERYSPASEFSYWIEDTIKLYL